MSRRGRKARIADAQASGHTWRVTEASGKTRTCSEDDGRTGWRRHAVKPDGRALCGLRPKLGWGVDLFSDEMPECDRCRMKLGTYCRPCKGTGHTRIEVAPRTYQGSTCEACGGSGDPKRPLRRVRVDANDEEAALATSGDVIAAIVAVRRRTECGLAEAYGAVRRAQDIAFASCGCIEVTSNGRRVRIRSSCVVPGQNDHEFIPATTVVPHA